MTSAVTATPYDPPPSFQLVHPLLYRSSSPTSQHFPFLSSLKLNSILSLGPELPSRALQSWCASSSSSSSTTQDGGDGGGGGGSTNGQVRFVHLGNQRSIPRETGDWKPVQDELIKDAIEFILDKRNLPCLVMDLSGVYETGILVACLRKLERWTLSAVLAEYASIAGSRTRPSNEQFIELFDTDLIVLPERHHLADWFLDPNDTNNGDLASF